MSVLESIKNKTININIDELIQRLKLELGIQKNANYNETIETANTLLEYAIYDTLLIILDITNRKIINERLYSIWVSMIKDYWGLNQYAKTINTSNEEATNENNPVGNVKSITQANEKIEFYEKETNIIEINGIKYNTGEIDFAKNVIYDKYKFPLYKHRKMRW